MDHEPGQTKVGIPVAVIRRLPVYHRYLSELQNREISRISSTELAAKIGVTASQLRQDLSWFGSFGQQGYGYRVEELLAEVSRILGLDREAPMVLVGAGHLGKAIVNYPNFRRRGFSIQAVFDNNPELIESGINGQTVRDAAGLAQFLQQHPIQIGIITVPVDAAQPIADIMTAGGIKGIWNFAPVALKVPPEVIVEHVHLGESLMVLSLKMAQSNKL